MSTISSAPDISHMTIPVDRWTEPFWEAAARGELMLPHCGSCHAVRWPPGPFCPDCRSQEVGWGPSGHARLYSYTVIRRPRADGTEEVIVPALVEFPEAGGVRIMAALVDTPVEAIRIGAPLTLGWNRRGERNVPVFSLA